MIQHQIHSECKGYIAIQEVLGYYNGHDEHFYGLIKRRLGLRREVLGTRRRRDLNTLLIVLVVADDHNIGVGGIRLDVSRVTERLENLVLGHEIRDSRP